MFEAIVWTACIAAIIYFAIRSYRLGKKRDFEDRDN